MSIIKVELKILILLNICLNSIKLFKKQLFSLKFKLKSKSRPPRRRSNRIARLPERVEPRR